MKNLRAALWAEYKKNIKSKILWITIFLFAFIPVMMGLLIYVVRHPEISAKLGIISAKASLFEVGDWSAYMAILHQSMAAIGLLGFGFVNSWVFGREYTEHTIKDILALPVSRSYIVHAKFIIITIWCLVLGFVLFSSGLLAGKVAGLSGWSVQVLNEGIKTYSLITILTLLLSPPIAFISCYSRGIVAALGFALLTMIMAQLIALAGLGAFFPWAIPGLHSAPEGTPGMELYPSSYIIISITCILGYLLTLYRWKTADHH